MITDVVMPQMGGAKLAAALASDRPGMKVLFVSGYAETTFQRHGEIDVTTRFLQKPFSLKTLARKIRKVLDADKTCAAAAASSRSPCPQRQVPYNCSLVNVASVPARAAAPHSGAVPRAGLRHTLENVV
jgi:DNA-binding NtrC family response regulator